MISRDCDIKEFINFVKDKDLPEISDYCEKEKRGAFGILNRTKKNEHSLIHHYIDLLKGLQTFINIGVKTNDVSDREFQLFRPIFENIPELLKFFK
ncbi:MAG: hypothetical protein HQ568_01090 [Calditrichaeota bacterium]|nr:hypothetical protein [Calditrichota bacterium]